MTQQEQIEELREALDATLHYIDAIPSEARARFPAMPGFDRDWVDCLMESTKPQSRDDAATAAPKLNSILASQPAAPVQRQGVNDLDTAGNRNPEDRYDGYKGRPLRDRANADQRAAWEEGRTSAAQPQEAGQAAPSDQPELDCIEWDTNGKLVSADVIVGGERVRLQAAPSVPDGWDKSRYGYSVLFNAIGAAVEWKPHKTIGISVEAFENAMLAIAPAPSVSADAKDSELPPLPEPLEINWPELNSNALGCGIEDRGIRDRYEAAEYGWQDGMDRAAERVPEQIFDADQMREYARAAIAAQSKGPTND